MVSETIRLQEGQPEIQFVINSNGVMELLVNGQPASKFQSALIATALNTKAELRNLLWLHVSKASPQGFDWPW